MILLKINDNLVKTLKYGLQDIFNVVKYHRNMSYRRIKIWHG